MADTGNSCIRKIDPYGKVTTLAGTNAPGWADGTGSMARFNTPQGLALDGAGNVYVADTGNHRIRKVTPAGVVTTIAGTVDAGWADGTDGVAKFNSPTGVAVDRAGSLVVADRGNNRIRLVTPIGIVSTLAGTTTSGGWLDRVGSDALFYWPSGVALDSAGNIYVADLKNHCIRELRGQLGPPPHSSVTSRSGITGNSPVAFSTTLTGLPPATIYYVQARGSNVTVEAGVVVRQC